MKTIDHGVKRVYFPKTDSKGQVIMKPDGTPEMVRTNRFRGFICIEDGTFKTVFSATERVVTELDDDDKPQKVSVISWRRSTYKFADIKTDVVAWSHKDQDVVLDQEVVGQGWQLMNASGLTIEKTLSELTRLSSEEKACEMIIQIHGELRPCT